MQIERLKFGINRRQQRERSILFPLFAPAQVFLLLAIVSVCGTVSGQCYVDPISGQRICTRPDFDSQPASSATSEGGAEQSAAHCRISVGDGSTGSATLVAVDASTGLVLTCSHLFDSATGRIVVTFPSGGRFAARLIDRDRSHDLAALTIQKPSVAALEVSNDEPVGPLSACGFGPNGQFRCIRGAIVGQATAVGATYPSLTIQGAVRPGDSGGAVLNPRGKLVGVVWGQRDGITYATCGRPVREFLDRVCGKPRTPSPQPQTPSPQHNWQAWSRDFDARLRALDEKKQDKGQYLQASDLAGYLRTADAPKLDATQYASKSEVDGGFKAITSRFESVRDRIESVHKRVETIATNKEGFFQGLSFGKLAVGALGLSGPLAAAVIVVGGLAGRRLKTTKERGARSETHSSILAPRSEPIAVDSPPPPQRTVPETHFVSVEKDSFAKAHQWASEHVARIVAVRRSGGPST